MGQIVTRSHYQVEILELTEDGRPLVARFVFEEPLESPRYRWFGYVDGTLAELPLPAVGDSLQLESALPGL